MRRNKLVIEQIDTKTLVINLYLTQMITLFIAGLLFYFFHHMTPVEAIISLLPKQIIKDFFIGIAFSLVIVMIVILLTKYLPKPWMDDGGINEKLFRKLPLWHIAVISILVGFIEEFLFRGAVQSLLGVILTSIIFTLIHFRYLKKWVLILSTFLISVGLGYLAVYSEWFTAFIAHAFIDFMQGVLIRKGWLH